MVCCHLNNVSQHQLLYAPESSQLPLFDLTRTIHSTPLLWLPAPSNRTPPQIPGVAFFSKHPPPPKLQHADHQKNPLSDSQQDGYFGKATHQTIHHRMCLGGSQRPFQTNTWSQTWLNKSLERPQPMPGSLYRHSSNRWKGSTSLRTFH